ENAKTKLIHTYTGPLDSDIGDDMLACDPEVRKYRKWKILSEFEQYLMIFGSNYVNYREASLYIQAKCIRQKIAYVSMCLAEFLVVRFIPIKRFEYLEKTTPWQMRRTQGSSQLEDSGFMKQGMIRFRTSLKIVAELSVSVS